MGELDFLIADLPPGTGDEVLTMAQKMKPNMAIIITTPQEIALTDSRRATNMAKRLNISHIGIVENMSGFICPECGYKIELFWEKEAVKRSRKTGCLMPRRYSFKYQSKRKS